MKTFEVTVVITVEAEDMVEAAQRVDDTILYMFEVSNGEDRLITYNILDDVEEVED